MLKIFLLNMKSRALIRYSSFLLILMLLISFHDVYATDTETIKPPTVAFILTEISEEPVEEVYYEPIIDLYGYVVIYNPNNVPIRVQPIEYKAYSAGKFIEADKFGWESEHSWDVKPYESVVDFFQHGIRVSSVENATGKRVLSTEELNLTGVAHFSIFINGSWSKEKFTAPLKFFKMINKIGSLLRTSNVIIEVRDEYWNPINGADVVLAFIDDIGFRGFTNESGIIRFSDVPMANYTIRASKEGYISQEIPLELSVPSTIMRIIQLYRSVRLTIEIKDEIGKPVSNANITLTSSAGNFTKTTNASGIAEFEIPRANYTLSVSKKGYLPYKESLDLSKIATSTKVIQLMAELTWWEKYQYQIIGAAIGITAICILIPIILKMRKRSIS